MPALLKVPDSAHAPSTAATAATAAMTTPATRRHLTTLAKFVTKLVPWALLAAAAYAVDAATPTGRFWRSPPARDASLMRAVVFDRAGPPSVLRTALVARPRPGAGQTLVRVRAAALNPVDYKMRAHGRFPLVRFPSLTGHDFAGDVVETGAGSGFAVGDRAFGSLPSAPNSAWGALAEFVAVDDAFLARVPDALNYSQAAALPLAAVTVVQALGLAVPLAPKSRVLITAGAGGVGHLALQYAARVLDLEVWTTSTSDALCRSLGAAHVVDYRESTVSAATGNEPHFDAVIDMIGGAQTGELVALVKPGGVFVNIFSGAWIDAVGSPELGAVMEGAELALRKLLAVLGLGPRYELEVFVSDGRALAHYAQYVADGTVQVLVEREYAGFEHAREMFERLESGRVKGKLVMLVP